MTDRVLLIIVSCLMTIGIIASYSLSTYIIRMDNMMEFKFLLVQLLASFTALVVMWKISQLDPDVWIPRIGFSLFGGSLVLIIAMPFLPSSIVPTINGAKRWIQIGISISPVELFKIGFIYFLAWSFSRKFYLQKAHDWREEIKVFIPYAVVFIVAIFMIVILQNDLGQGMVLGSALLVMLLFAGGSLMLFGSLLGFGFLLVTAFIISSSYRLGKVKVWWAGVQDSILSFLPSGMADFLRVDAVGADQAYQVSQAANAIAHGGWFGTGIGGGILKLGFVSDVHTDFVMAGIIEETGIIGALLVTSLIISMIFWLLRIANRSENPVYYLFCIGIAVMFTSQFAMNALGIVGLAPVKGITLPFVSYGGSSIIALSIAVGMVMAISKRANLKNLP